MFANGEYHGEYHHEEGDFIIAIDGGYNHLYEYGIVPDILIGDMDSIDYRKPDNLDRKHVIKLNPKKDDTDALAAINYAIEQGYDYFELYAFLGKELNHTLGNIQLFRYLNKKGIEFKAFFDNKIYEVVSNGNKKFKGKGTFSVLSLTPESIVSIYNAEYRVRNHVFSDDFPLGIDNVCLKGRQISVTVKKGMVLVIYSPIDEEEFINEAESLISSIFKPKEEPKPSTEEEMKELEAYMSQVHILDKVTNTLMPKVTPVKKKKRKAKKKTTKAKTKSIKEKSIKTK